MSDADSKNFWTRYRSLCLKSKFYPLRCVIKQLGVSELRLPVENVRSEHWSLILEALKDDDSLTKVHFESNLSIASQREPITKRKKKINKYYPLPYGCSAKNIAQICTCISQIMKSSGITVLKLENITLTEEDAETLSSEIKHSNITHFSLAGSLLKDNAVEFICENLSRAPVQWLDLSSCGINLEGLKHVALLIKIQHRLRFIGLFPHTLRYQIPSLDKVLGLSRVSLNNSCIGDMGVKMIIDHLEDDMWIKVFDLQNCFIGNEGAKLFLDALKLNKTLQIIDLRQNDIDESNIEKISWQLNLNKSGKDLKYTLGPLWEPRKCVRRFPKLKASLKTKVLKSSPPKLKSKNSASVENKCSICDEFLKCKFVSKEDATSQTVTSELDSEEEEGISAKRELLTVKKTLVNEIKLRECLMRLLKKYKMENSLLRKEIEKMVMLDDHILIDQKTFSEVKNTFDKFKRFLDVMKEYGLFECIAMLGINENTDIVLKPMIVNATKKCMQLIENEPSVVSLSESIDSILDSDTKVLPSIPTKQMSCCKCRLPDCKSVNGKNGISSKLPCSKEIPEESNPITNSTSIEKALVQRVYKEVRENYSNSSHSNHKICHANPAARRPEIPVRKKPKIIPKTSAVKNPSTSQSPNCVKNVKSTKELFNSVAKDEKSELIQSHSMLSSSISVSTTTDKKTSSSQTPSSPTVRNSTKRSIEEDTEKSKASVKISGSQCLAQKSLVLQESSIKALDQKSSGDKISSTSKSKLKKAAKKGKCPHTNPPTPMSVTPHLSRNNSNTSESEVSSEVVTNESTAFSKSKSRCNKMHSDLSNHKSFKPEGLEILRSKSDTSVKSFSDKSGKDRNKDMRVSSSDGRSDTSKSYLVSVSDASTDRDVKSLAESEVYSSEKSSKGAFIKKPTPVAANATVLSLVATCRTAVDTGDNSKSNKDKMRKKGSPPVQPANKNQKDNGSESSVPSLSDITTVSSHSLNTDSVMGQLSES